MASTCNFTFTVSRRSPELIPPAEPTPREMKPLSDIDDQQGNRFLIPIIYLYPPSQNMKRKDPAQVIREALAKALVFYYPFAGRLRELTNRKLVVDCTGEGVMFVEADADVTLQQFGHRLHPPIPGIRDLLCPVPVSNRVTDCPLWFIQITRLKCGGFVFTVRMNHTMCDGYGLFKFLSAVGEIARGAAAPKVLPVWERHLFNSREPPYVTHNHREYEQDLEGAGLFRNVVVRSFFFGAEEISALRRRLPPDPPHYTAVELLTACIWRCSTIAVYPDPNKEVRLIYLVNARHRLNPPIPKGYYGNAFLFANAITLAGDLLTNPFQYAVELVKETKSRVTDEYIKSVSDLLVTSGRPMFTMAGSCLVSGATRIGLEEVDFGWGKAVYAGPAKDVTDQAALYNVSCFCVPWKNEKGESGIVVPICLPANAVEVFAKELYKMVKNDDGGPKSSSFIASPL